MPDDPLGLLQREQIQEELELSDDQIALVKELQLDIQRQTREIFAAQAKFGGDAGKMVEAANRAVRENIQKELKEILSPSQMKRLGQLEVQMKLKNRGRWRSQKRSWPTLLGFRKTIAKRFENHIVIQCKS